MSASSGGNSSLLGAFLHSDLGEAGLDPHEFRVYFHLVRRADKKREAWPSQRNIARTCLMSERLVRSVLARLEARGPISRKPQSRKDGSRTTDLITVAAVTPRHRVPGGAARSTEQEVGPGEVDPVFKNPARSREPPGRSFKGQKRTTKSAREGKGGSAVFDAIAMGLHGRTQNLEPRDRSRIWRVTRSLVEVGFTAQDATEAMNWMREIQNWRIETTPEDVLREINAWRATKLPCPFTEDEGARVSSGTSRAGLSLSVHSARSCTIDAPGRSNCASWTTPRWYGKHHG